VNIEAVVAYCLAEPGAEETYPFGDRVLAAKVGGKGLAFIGQAGPGSVGVKCGVTEEEGAELRERYPDAVSAMARIGRHGWNRVELGAGVPAAELEELIDASYDEIVRRLPKAKRP
jgi:predicted DNA-binding protein (MmcQ/YjbR family)